jgi:hypothetical protein
MAFRKTCSRGFADGENLAFAGGSDRHGRDDDDVVNALVASRVCIADAAKALGVSSSDLRRAMAVVPALLDISLKRDEERLDKAEKILHGMLASENALERKDVAFFVLGQSKRAVSRGWRQPDSEVNVNVDTGERVLVSFAWGVRPLARLRCRRLSMVPTEPARANDRLRFRRPGSYRGGAAADCRRGGGSAPAS